MMSSYVISNSKQRPNNVQYYSRARPGSKEPNSHMSVGHEHDVMTDLAESGGASIMSLPAWL